MFPISDTVKPSSFPLITYLIIGINVVIFLYALLSGVSFVEEYGLVPARVDFSDPTTLLTFVTSQFLHGGFFHIISNMWFLHIFGNNVEDRMGHVKYLFFYLIAGAIGGLLQYVFNTDSIIPMIGASGAVSGVLGAYYVFFPHSRIKTAVFVLYIFSIVNVPAVTYILYWFIIQLFSGIASLPSLQFATGGVAFWAHVGGFVAGYLMAKTFREETDYIEGEIVED